MTIEPFLKWPGGKRWLVSRYSHLFPTNYRGYLEPFVGSGAVFFSESPASSLLSDTNEELIDVYRTIKREPDALEKILNGYQKRHCEDFYYQIRSQKPRDSLLRSARFIYLNRTCFNGMYRVNRKGDFNVPIGTKTAVAFEPGYLRDVAHRLKTAKLRNWGFAKTLASASAGDFVFVDPPYTVMHNNNGFIKYNANLFSWEDQVKLSIAVREAANRGALILLTNADHSDIRKLYAGFGQQIQVSRASVLAGTNKGRRGTTELIVRNYSEKRSAHRFVGGPA